MERESGAKQVEQVENESVKGRSEEGQDGWWEKQATLSTQKVETESMGHCSPATRVRCALLRNYTVSVVHTTRHTEMYRAHCLLNSIPKSSI